MKDWVSLGYICRAFGIKGGVVVKRYFDHGHAFVSGQKLVFRLKDSTEQHFTIESVTSGGRLSLKEVIDRDGAESLIGADVVMPRAELPLVAEDEFYLFDLQGARVVDATGVLVGEVVGFSSNNAQELLEVRVASNKLISIPLIKPIVSCIDYNDKIVTIDPPSGFLDLAA